MEDAERFKDWANKAKLGNATIDILDKEGFNCLESIVWLSDADLDKSKSLRAITMGQWKLLMAAIGRLKTSQEAVHEEPSTPVTQTPVTQSEDKMVDEVLKQLGMSLPQTSKNKAGPHASWQDPQVYLRQLGKGPTSFYDIPDFVTGCNQLEEIVMDSSALGPQLVLKSGPAKVKLDQISQTQWSIANIAILHKLIEDGSISNMDQVLDYQSFTVRILQLTQRFTLHSVLVYDREYRKLQSECGFRWGTDVGHHLQSVTLVPKGSQYMNNRNSFQDQKGKSGQRRYQQKGPTSSNGQPICLKFNSQAGCMYRDCKFRHACSMNGCYENHSAIEHGQIGSQARAWAPPGQHHSQPKNWGPPPHGTV
jgi:hypothetical protein